MKIKQITIHGAPCVVGLGDHVCGRGHFLTLPHGRNIRAHYIKGFIISDTFKSITADVVETELDTDQLNPLPEYFEPGTQVLTVSEKFIKDYPNTSTGPRYSHFYGLQSEGLAGDILYRNALAIHVLQLFGVWILDQGGELIQPVTASIIYGQTSEKYTVGVEVVDGVAPFLFSTDGNNYGPESVLEYEKLPAGQNSGRKAYVKDAAGTVAVYALDSDNWYNLTPVE